MEIEPSPLVFSPVRHRYALAALKIDEPRPSVLDVGGYRSREQHLTRFFEVLDYVSVNVGTAWYKNEESHHLFDGVTLPFGDRSFPYVICVDTLEHVEASARHGLVGEIIRVASVRAVIVVPIAHGDVSDEERLLNHSRRFRIQPMPSLLQHVKYGLPATGELAGYAKGHRYALTFASPRHLYWSFQMAMLLNQFALGAEAESVNRRLYESMESTLLPESDSLNESEAYRAILTVDRRV